MQAGERIEALTRRWIAAGKNVYVAKEPPFDPDDGGVPPAMWDGEPDPSGWVRWRATEPRVAPGDLQRVEERIGAKLPPLVRAWLSTSSIGPLESERLRLPALWSDSPLRDLESLLDAWSPLERAGFVVIGEDGNDAGPLCIDLAARDEWGDARVVAFDHEALIALGPVACARREMVAPLAQARFSSFAALLDALDRS
ncbi:SMI1/KNR4 family protein [Sandaracinus amylolyticus]|uniref:Knr4/Smi1-like domain-containing protein n=1 Tax=Sandaracinus amylolyticus TaxID=927083 RepID=A0A0F6W249_9BACT|nr:SMI1/KNR4 family protein [Sandaracinus amylolyticus]AKF05473.1 hypothetical protein DB32_002622 [Sandaracinus amylolyticus]